MIESIAPQSCPACGHHSSGILAGRCSAFVPILEGPVLAGYCGCLCYDHITGRSWRDDQRASLAPPPAPGTDPQEEHRGPQSGRPS